MASFSVTTALYAIQSGDQESLERGIKSSSEEERVALLSSAINGATLLHWAAECGNVGALDILLQYSRQGLELDQAESQGATPLMWSAGEGHLACVRRLLENGADPCAEDLLGETPLHWAALNGHLETVKTIVQEGKRRNTEPPPSSSSSSSSSSSGTTVKMFNIDAKSQAGNTPLFQATINKHVEVVRFLLESGADPQIKNANNESPFSLAEKLGDTSLLKSFDEESRAVFAEIDFQKRRLQAVEEREQKLRAEYAESQLQLAKTNAMLKISQQDLADEKAAHQQSRLLLQQMQKAAGDLESSLDSLVQQITTLRAQKQELEDKLAERDQSLVDVSTALLQLQQGSAAATSVSSSSSSSSSLPSSLASPNQTMLRHLTDLQKTLTECSLQISQVQQQYFSSG